MENLENDKLENLKQQQLLNEILSKNINQNNQSVIDAYVEATTENKDKSVQDIEKRKTEILKAKEADQQRKNKEQIDTVERQETLAYIDSIIEKFSDTEAMIKKWDEEAKREAYERRKLANQIVRDMTEQRNTKKTPSKTFVSQKKVEAYDRENSRRKYKELLKKKANIANQIKEQEMQKQRRINQERIEKRQEQVRAEQERMAKIQRKTADAFKQYNLNNSNENNKVEKRGFFKKFIEKIFPKKEKKLLPSKTDGNVIAKNNRPIHVNTNIRTITGVENNASKAYRGTMETYAYGSVSKAGMFFDQTIGTRPATSVINKNVNFRDTLSFKANERQAQIDAARKTATLQKNAIKVSSR